LLSTACARATIALSATRERERENERERERERERETERERDHLAHPRPRIISPPALLSPRRDRGSRVQFTVLSRAPSTHTAPSLVHARATSPFLVTATIASQPPSSVQTPVPPPAPAHPPARPPTHPPAHPPRAHIRRSAAICNSQTPRAHRHPARRVWARSPGS